MKYIHKNLNLFSTFVLIFLLNGCSGYKRIAVEKNQSISLDNKAIILHQKNKELYFYNVEVLENHFQGDLSTSFPELYKEDQLHFFVDSTFTISETKIGKISIPFTAITKVEVYEVDAGKTMLYNIGGLIVGISVLLLLILIDMSN